MPYDTMPATQRRVWRRLSSRISHKIPYKSKVSLGTPDNKTLGKRQELSDYSDFEYQSWDAVKHGSFNSMPSIAMLTQHPEHISGSPYDTRLATYGEVVG
jgi:hypothetical protein